MHIVFRSRKKSFSIIEMKLRHCITLQKNTEKTILFYVTVTVSHRTYLGIDQCIKRKFLSSGAKMWKRRMFDTDLVICLCFVFASSVLIQFHYQSQSQQRFLKLDFEA